MVEREYSQNDIRAFFCGKIIKTVYFSSDKNLYYKITDVDFSKTPLSNLEIEPGKVITYQEYYE